MANYANLLATIAANIYTNGNNEVTAAMVKSAVDSMVASLGAGYQFMGVATPATTPGNTDVKQFYIASTPGTFTNFLDSGSDPLEVNDGEVAVLKYDTAWSKEVAIDVTTSIPLSDQLGDAEDHAPTQRVFSQFVGMILDGLVPWVDGEYYIYASGDVGQSASFARTPIFPADIEDNFSGLDNYGSANAYRYHRSYRSFWKDGIYVGHLLYGDYYDPAGNIVPSIDYDSFAVVVWKSDTPEYTDARLVALDSTRAGAGKYSFNVPYIALGDSTTAGAFSDDGHTSWADIIVRESSFPSYAKKAVGGTTTMYVSGLSRLSSQVAQIPANFDGFITLLIGVNDCGQQNPVGDVDAVLAMNYADLDDTTDFAEAFRYNLETIKRNCPEASVLVLLPLAVGTAAQWPPITEANLELYRAAERKICEALSVPYVEPAKEAGISAAIGSTYWDTFMADKVHPNTPGYEKIARWAIGKFIEFCN